MIGIMKGVNTITANNENNMSKNLVTYSLSFSASMLQNHNQKAVATPHNTIWYCESAAAMTFISPREICSSTRIIEFLYTIFLQWIIIHQFGIKIQLGGAKYKEAGNICS